MKVPYVSDPPPASSPEEQAIISRIRARRAPRPLQPLDLALLHSPSVADGWNSFVGAVRTKTSIPADLRELAISRVAVVNKAGYEWMHHAPLAVAAGVSEEAMSHVKNESSLALGAPAEGFTDKQWATLVLADEMTRRVEVREETFAELKRLFNEVEIVELVATV